MQRKQNDQTEIKPNNNKKTAKNTIKVQKHKTAQGKNRKEKERERGK